MSILINGMEMPTNEPMLVKINPDGSVSTTAKHGYKKYEAVPVPPHGRLIDADALDADLTQLDMRTGEDDAIGFSIYEIDNAPTIIPAEEGET